MASLFALRRVASPCLRSKLLHPTRPGSVFRPFNTNAAQVTDYDAGDHSSNVDRRNDSSVSRRQDRFPGFLDVFNPSPSRSLSQVLNLMDQFMEEPFLAASRGIGSGAGARRGWDVKEDDDALYLRMDMPGLGKENIKVTVEHNTLIIKGEEEKQSEEGESRRKYSSRLDLPPNLYKLDSIKAEMKNGVLKMEVPKVKEEERKNVMEVNIA